MQSASLYKSVQWNGNIKDFLKPKNASIDFYTPKISFLPVCAETGVLLKFPMRSEGCKTPMCYACLFEYSSETTAKDVFKCKINNKPYSISQLYLDIRLANFLTYAIQSLATDTQLKKCNITVNEFSQMVIVFNGRQVVQRTNTASVGRIGRDDGTDAMQEIQSTIVKRSYEYLSMKNNMKQLSPDLEKQVGVLIQKLTWEDTNIVQEVKKNAGGYRKLKAVPKCVFGFSKGKLYCSIPSNTVIEYEIVYDADKQQVKKALDAYYGAAWFFADLKGVPTIFAVGGSSSFFQALLDNNVNEFSLVDKKATLKRKVLGGDMKQLNVAHAGCVYVPAFGTFKDPVAYMFGGVEIVNQQAKTTRARNSILQLNFADKRTMIVIGTLKKPRFNQSYTFYNNKIYISSGLNLPSWESDISLEMSIPDMRSKNSQMSISLEIFDCQTKSVYQYEVTMDTGKINYFAHRCLSVIVPVKSTMNVESIYLVIFGGKTAFGTGEYAMSININEQSKKLAGRTFGDNQFWGQITVGDDKVISKKNTIVDLEGMRSENFSEWLCLSETQEGGSKMHQFALTSQESELGFRWRF